MPVLRNTNLRMTDTGAREPRVNLWYDPRTGTWVPVTNTTTRNNTSSSSTSSRNPPETSSGSEEKDYGGNVDSQKEADKEYIEAEFNVLSGEMNLTPTEKSIRIRVNDTVKIEGLGKYLSGLYFVSAISRTIGKDSGYSHSLTLIKNGFGNSIKKAQTPAPSSKPATNRKEEVVKKSPEIKIGDSVKIVGDDAVYSNAHDGVKVPDWVKKNTQTVRDISDDKTRVLLMPIFSWTYIKYVQKV